MGEVSMPLLQLLHQLLPLPMLLLSQLLPMLPMVLMLLLSQLLPMLLLPLLLLLPQLLLRSRLLRSRLPLLLFQLLTILLPQLLTMLLLQLPTMLLPQLLTMLPQPQLSNMLDTKSTTRSIMFPRSLSRSTPLPTPHTMSSTTLQSLVLSLVLFQLPVLSLLLLPQLHLLLKPLLLLRKLKKTIPTFPYSN